MAGVTSTVTDPGSTPSKKAAVARSAGSAALGYVVPWSTPARKVAAHVAHRHSDSSPTRPWFPFGRKKATASVSVAALADAGRRAAPAAKRISTRATGRAGLVALGIGAVIGGGVVFSAIRRNSHTPPPVAARPPRVEDVPTQ